jgi:flagella basal body P-ring formation protein FlgA
MVGGEILIGLAAGALALAPTQGACMRPVRDIAAGTPLAARDFEHADCPAKAPRAAFSYDARRGAARASRDIAAGEAVAALPAFALADVSPGQKLYVSVRVGPVVVEREVEALQSGRAGGRIFVKGSDGRVFSALIGEPGR